MAHNVISRKILEITVIYTKISDLDTLYLSVVTCLLQSYRRLVEIVQRVIGGHCWVMESLGQHHVLTPIFNEYVFNFKFYL